MEPANYLTITNRAVRRDPLSRERFIDGSYRTVIIGSFDIPKDALSSFLGTDEAMSFSEVMKYGFSDSFGADESETVI